jgi:hypothetical protein
MRSLTNDDAYTPSARTAISLRSHISENKTRREVMGIPKAHVLEAEEKEYG